ncbi:MAG TPA: CapA family protein [Actinomycetota bacterium]|nr:CapA family protein [Actinomycetota bacterium]
MAIRLALAGDTMLGRGVAERLASDPADSLVAPEVADTAREADLFVLNLECCISDRGAPWPDPRKPFFFKAPPKAVETLVHLGVDCVTLANNHALDFGTEALLDTVRYLNDAGITSVGAGSDVVRARSPAILTANGFRLGVIGVADHPEEFAATPDRPGIAFVDLGNDDPDWLPRLIRGMDADSVVVTPHWGPNMTPEPVPHVRSSGRAFLEAGVSLIAGHSAHVFQGVDGPILYDLGDFLDDYAVDPILRNDLGLLFLVTIDEGGPVRLEALPLKLDFCYTKLAQGEDAAWVKKRFTEACASFGTAVTEENGRLVIDWR